jgi:2-polyprenyl-3-methyl-5-hydroxy-6-metoxy-1,4-benzoquinol methylase
MASIAPAPSDEVRRDELAGRLFGAVGGAMDLLVVYLGDRLGLYRSLADDGPATAPQLAARTGIAPRYAREWLEHQAVAGFLDVDDVAADADARSYRLPAGHAEAILDDDSLAHVAPLARFIVGAAQTMPQIIDAYRSGEGVDWAEYGADVIEAQEAANRPQFAAFVGDWIRALPDIAEPLRSRGGRVADIACGTGWSSISIARHFPRVRVDGVDVDEGSIARARSHTAEAGLTDRVSFLNADAAASEGTGQYDLVTIFEAVHDMANPVEVLAAARNLLKPGGAVLVADELVGEAFSAPGNDTEKLYYAYSVVCCLPAGMVTKPSAATGTVMRPATLQAYAREAGFGGFAILPIEHEGFRFYRLDP